MKIYYLDNSGFAVLMRRSLLLFDYYNPHPAEGVAPALSSGVVPPEALSGFERVYVFASHKHFDHFNRAIFALAAHHPRVKYILDAGITRRPAGVDCTALRLGEVFADDALAARACPSTDIGVSFIVQTEGKTLFHAGDLNCWHWMLDWSEAEEAAARAQFDEALDALRPHLARPDAAFFPVDGRMKGTYDDGARQFAHAFRPRLLVPMHFREDFALAAQFAAQPPEGVPVWAPARRGDCVQLV